MPAYEYIVIACDLISHVGEKANGNRWERGKSAWSTYESGESKVNFAATHDLLCTCQYNTVIAKIEE